MKSILDYTKNDFLNMESKFPETTFSDIIIVPTDDLHDSGWRCMKFILCKKGEIVGVVGGYSDVVHINGIGGWGETFKELIKPIDWRIDCLPGSGCLRLFTDKDCVISRGFVLSDFIFEVKE